jgi:transcription antitermination factor NusG
MLPCVILCQDFVPRSLDAANGWSNLLSSSFGVEGIESQVPENGTPRVSQERWYAIRTRSRHEKVAIRQLDGAGVEAFLPLVTQVHRWVTGPKHVDVPLFPGYAFVRITYTPDQRVRVLRAHGVAGFVGTQGKGTPIPDKQIEDIKLLLNNKIPFKNSMTLRVGQRVRVKGGSLDGVEGVLVGTRSQRKLVILIEPIQRSLSVDLEGYDVEAI